jgi:hypothetical protein
MLPPVIYNFIYAICFVLLGASVGSFFVLMSVGFIHKITDRLTPNIDEDKEILRGNLAVAEYFGRVASASIIGVSLVVAASVLAGVLSALHG